MDMRIDRHDEAVCGVCARQSVGFGYTPDFNRTRPIIWVCDDPECLQIASESYTMKQQEYSRIEALARDHGGAEGGAYLDTIGKTDLATMTEDQWREFLSKVIGGYREFLKAETGRRSPF